LTSSEKFVKTFDRCVCLETLGNETRNNNKERMTTLGDIEIEFDFESIVRTKILPPISETPSTQNTFGLGNFGRVDPKLRTVVCIYWLYGLCQKVQSLFCSNATFKTLILYFLF
jgi:hypothetical protein